MKIFILLALLVSCGKTEKPLAFSSPANGFERCANELHAENYTIRAAVNYCAVNCKPSLIECSK